MVGIWGSLFALGCPGALAECAFSSYGRVGATFHHKGLFILVASLAVEPELLAV